MLEHERWLKIASDDLKVARLTLAQDFFCHVAFNCQQSAEKSLKGFLSFKRHQIMKTHDLIQLLELCALFDNEFGKLRSAVVFISPFATKFRYPTEYDLLDRAGAKLAIKYAQDVLKFVLKKMAEPQTNQKNIFL